MSWRNNFKNNPSQGVDCNNNHENYRDKILDIDLDVHPLSKNLKKEQDLQLNLQIDSQHNNNKAYSQTQYYQNPHSQYKTNTQQNSQYANTSSQNNTHINTPNQNDQRISNQSANYQNTNTKNYTQPNHYTNTTNIDTVFNINEHNRNLHTQQSNNYNNTYQYNKGSNAHKYEQYQKSEHKTPINSTSQDDYVNKFNTSINSLNDYNEIIQNKKLNTTKIKNKLSTPKINEKINTINSTISPINHFSGFLNIFSTDTIANFFVNLLSKNKPKNLENLKKIHEIGETWNINRNLKHDHLKSEKIYHENNHKTNENEANKTSASWQEINANNKPHTTQQTYEQKHNRNNDNHTTHINFEQKSNNEQQYHSTPNNKNNSIKNTHNEYLNHHTSSNLPKNQTTTNYSEHFTNNNGNVNRQSANDGQNNYRNACINNTDLKNNTYNTNKKTSNKYSESYYSHLTNNESFNDDSSMNSSSYKIKNVKSSNNDSQPYSDNLNFFNKKDYDYNNINFNIFHSDNLNVFDGFSDDSSGVFHKFFTQNNDKKFLFLGIGVSAIVFISIIFLLYKSSTKINGIDIIKADVINYKNRPENFDKEIQENQKIYTNFSGEKGFDEAIKIQNTNEDVSELLTKQKTQTEIEEKLEKNEEIINSFETNKLFNRQNTNNISNHNYDNNIAANQNINKSIQTTNTEFNINPNNNLNTKTHIHHTNNNELTDHFIANNNNKNLNTSHLKLRNLNKYNKIEVIEKNIQNDEPGIYIEKDIDSPNNQPKQNIDSLNSQNVKNNNVFEFTNTDSNNNNIAYNNNKMNKRNSKKFSLKSFIEESHYDNNNTKANQNIKKNTKRTTNDNDYYVNNHYNYDDATPDNTENYSLNSVDKHDSLKHHNFDEINLNQKQTQPRMRNNTNYDEYEETTAQGNTKENSQLMHKTSFHPQHPNTNSINQQTEQFATDDDFIINNNLHSNETNELTYDTQRNNNKLEVNDTIEFKNTDTNTLIHHNTNELSNIDDNFTQESTYKQTQNQSSENFNQFTTPSNYGNYNIKNKIINTKSDNEKNSSNQLKAIHYVVIYKSQNRSEVEEELEAISAEFPLLEGIGKKIIPTNTANGISYYGCIGPMTHKTSHKLVENFSAYGINTSVISF